MAVQTRGFSDADQRNPSCFNKRLPFLSTQALTARRKLVRSVKHQLRIILSHPRVPSQPPPIEDILNPFAGEETVIDYLLNELVAVQRGWSFMG